MENLWDTLCPRRTDALDRLREHAVERVPLLAAPPSGVPRPVPSHLGEAVTMDGALVGVFTSDRAQPVTTDIFTQRLAASGRKVLGSGVLSDGTSLFAEVATEVKSVGVVTPRLFVRGHVFRGGPITIYTTWHTGETFVGYADTCGRRDAFIPEPDRWPWPEARYVRETTVRLNHDWDSGFGTNLTEARAWEWLGGTARLTTTDKAAIMRQWGNGAPSAARLASCAMSYYQHRRPLRNNPSTARLRPEEQRALWGIEHGGDTFALLP